MMDDEHNEQSLQPISPDEAGLYVAPMSVCLEFCRKADAWLEKRGAKDPVPASWGFSFGKRKKAGEKDED